MLQFKTQMSLDYAFAWEWDLWLKDKSFFIKA